MSLMDRESGSGWAKWWPFDEEIHVEWQVHFDHLRENGCDEGDGFVRLWTPVDERLWGANKGVVLLSRFRYQAGATGKGARSPGVYRMKTREEIEADGFNYKTANHLHGRCHNRAAASSSKD